MKDFELPAPIGNAKTISGALVGGGGGGHQTLVRNAHLIGTAQRRDSNAWWGRAPGQFSGAQATLAGRSVPHRPDTFLLQLGILRYKQAGKACVRVLNNDKEKLKNKTALSHAAVKHHVRTDQ